MSAEVKPICSLRDYEAALREVERSWGTKAKTCYGTGSMCLPRSASVPACRQ